MKLQCLDFYKIFFNWINRSILTRKLSSKNNNFILVLFSNSIADSPLLQVPGGTKKTERRRSRSRNRQEIESELARKLNEIPMVHDTIEYLLSSYSLIKVFNQINFYYVR